MIIHVCPTCSAYSGECIEVIHESDDKSIKEQHLKEGIHCTKCGWVGTWDKMKKVSI